MSGSGKTKSKTQRATSSASANQLTHANEEEEVTATMLRDIIKALKADICNSIQSAVKGFQADLAAVKAEITTTTGALQQTINLQEGRLAAVEDHATKASDALAEMEVAVTALKGEIRALQNKYEDLENRLRRNNLRIVGIAEGRREKLRVHFQLERPVGSPRTATYRPGSPISPSQAKAGATTQTFYSEGPLLPR